MLKFYGLENCVEESVSRNGGNGAMKMEKCTLAEEFPSRLDTSGRPSVAEFVCVGALLFQICCCNLADKSKTAAVE